MHPPTHLPVSGGRRIHVRGGAAHLPLVPARQQGRWVGKLVVSCCWLVLHCGSVPPSFCLLSCSPLLPSPLTTGGRGPKSSPHLYPNPYPNPNPTVSTGGRGPGGRRGCLRRQAAQASCLSPIYRSCVGARPSLKTSCASILWHRGGRCGRGSSDSSGSSSGSSSGRSGRSGSSDSSVFSTTGPTFPAMWRTSAATR